MLDLTILLEQHQEFQKTNMVRVLRQSVRLITSEISKMLAEKGHTGLSARHLHVFENLDPLDNNIIKLANRAGISKQAMSKLVKEVSAGGYVSVVTDQRDSRVQLVQLTEKGAELLTTMQTELKDRYRDIMEKNVVSQQDFETTLNTVKSIAKYLEPKHLAAGANAQG